MFDRLVKHTRNNWRYFCLLLLPSFLSGCLPSTHHFRTGKTIESGQAQTHWGYSSFEVYECNKQDDVCNWDKETLYNVSRSFRLGVREEWGPFTGVDAGYQMEIYGTMEFDLRLGLPQLIMGKDTIHHAIGMGWALGGFPDNSYFIDYVISKTSHFTTFYFNTRQVYLATPLAEAEIGLDETESGTIFSQNKRWLQQYGLGFQVSTPNSTWGVPDYYHFQFLVTGPTVSLPFSEIKNQSPFNFNPQFNFGLGWDY